MVLAVVSALVLIAIAMISQWCRLLRSTIASSPDHYENLSVEEAQNLLSYDICLPSYLPLEVTNEPVLKYLDVWPDSGAELALLLGEDSIGRAVEIRQWYSPSEQLSDPNLDYLRQSLVAWQVGWEKAAEVIDGVEFKSVKDETGSRSVWLVEITSPGSLKGSVATGSVGETFIYRVYSEFTLEETLKIAHSIRCGDQAID